MAPHADLLLDLGLCLVFVECFDYLSASEYVNMKLIRNVIVPPRPILFDMWIWQDFFEDLFEYHFIRT